MHELIDENQFANFKYLPHYATFLLTERLEEFVTVGIRFCREADLPLLKPLSRFSEQELVQLSLDTNRAMLEAIVENRIAAHIQEGLEKYLSNTIGYIDKEELLAEDLTLGFHLRRKVFAHFLDGYSKNVVLHKLIIAEVDIYTTQEEKAAYSIFINAQKEKLSVHSNLLLETQKLAGVGSYVIDFRDKTKTFYTPEYLRILECDTPPTYEEVLACIHPEDRPGFKNKIDLALERGGLIESEFRYKKNSNEKRLSDKGIIEMHDGKPALAKGSITDVTERHAVIQKLKDAQVIYQLGQQLNHYGSWLWNLETGLLQWSDEMYAIFEVDQPARMTLGEFLSFVHTDDRSRIKTAIESGDTTEYTFTIVTGKGVLKTLKGLSRVETNDQKIITHCYGTCQDISGETKSVSALEHGNVAN